MCTVYVDNIYTVTLLVEMLLWSRKLALRLKSNWNKLGIRVKSFKINFELLKVKFAGIKSIINYDEVGDDNNWNFLCLAYNKNSIKE